MIFQTMLVRVEFLAIIHTRSYVNLSKEQLEGRDRDKRPGKDKEFATKPYLHKQIGYRPLLYNTV